MQPIEYPLAFGHWHLRGDRLQCRMPRRDVEVRAPGALLAAVLGACTGRLRWREVAAQLATRWEGDAVEAFLGQLACQGVLVEASEALAHWAELGQLPAPHMRLASDAEVPQLAGRAQARLLPGVGALARIPVQGEALAALLAARESHRTFDDHPISADALGAVLWAAHGVTRAATNAQVGRHRTIASAGNLHSARWFVFVLRALAGETAAPVGRGVYEARFHVEGGVTLEPAAGNADLAWRVLLDPRILGFASALVVPVGDVAWPARKYGNRATLFTCLEAGQALQNAQLMAAALGLGACVRGDTSGEAVRSALGLSPHPCHPDGAALVLPSLVLGCAPSAQQRAAQHTDRGLQVGPLPAVASASVAANRLPAEAGFGFAAGPVLEGGRAIFASGRAGEPQLALDKAQAEAWERQGWASLGPVVEAACGDLPEAIGPQALVAYSAGQYRLAGFPFRRFDARRACLWREGVDVESGRTIHVLAECVHALSALPPAFRQQAYTCSSTSGVAAWTDREGALCRATLELIERDAFLRAWLAQHPPALTRIESLPQPARVRIDALAASGLRVAVAQVEHGFVPVYAVFIQGLRRPFTAITAGADFDPAAALANALSEAEGRAAHAAAFPATPLAAAHEVRSTADIDRFHQTPRLFRRSDFFAAAAPSQHFGDMHGSSCRDWPALRARLQASGLPLYAVDLTPPGAAIRQGRVALHVMRAFVPGLLPIWFQHGLHPAGLAAFRAACAGTRLRRASDFIHPFT